MLEFFRDLRFAARRLAKDRGFTCLAVLCLCLGIGANSTMFSLVDGYWTRPLPVRDPRGLVYLFTSAPDSPRAGFSWAEFLDYQNEVRSFAGLIATERRGPVLTGDGFADSTMSNVVSENYFAVLGIEAQHGRVFDAADAKSGDRVVVMSHNLWLRRYGGDPNIVGRTVRLNGLYVVIGVAPKGFRGTELWQDSDFWIPISSWDPSGQEQVSREYRSKAVIGRLRPGVPMDSVEAELRGISTRLAQAYPATNRGCSVIAESSREHVLRSTRYAPVILLGIVSLVLLIACCNLANLLLARANVRNHEIGVCVAMGAGRLRVVRQLIAESLLLTALGLTAAIFVAAWLISMLPTVIIPPANNYLHMEWRLDSRVIIFTLGISVVTVFLFGLVPAIQTARTDVISALKGSAANSARGRTINIRSGIVAVQVAFSMVLLISAGLFVRTFVKSMSIDPGFRRENILVAEISPRYEAAQARAFYQQVLEQVRSTDSVRQATLALRAPLSGSGGGLAGDVTISDSGHAERAPVRIKYTAVEPNYFRTLGIPLLRGRAFTAHDTAGSVPVVVVNEAMRRRYWPTKNPVGTVIQVNAQGSVAERTVVGVVGDTRINSITEEDESYFYLPYAQTEFSSMYLIANAGIEPLRLASRIRTAVAAVDPEVSVHNVTTMNLLVRSQLYQQQVAATVAGILGAIGLLLAVVGLYGVLACTVAQRRRELGIRIALGAPRRSAMNVVLREGFGSVALGAMLGLVLSAFTARLISGMIYGISVHDPVTFVGVSILMFAAATAGCWLPAKRATQIDPATALRHE